MAGKYCCIANDRECNHNSECCEMDCDPRTNECSVKRRVYPKNSIHTGTGIANRCQNDNQCIDFVKGREGLSCQRSIGWDDKLANYCCISENKPCNPKAERDECCIYTDEMDKTTSKCNKITSKCNFKK